MYIKKNCKPGPKPFTHKVCPDCGIKKPREDYYKKGNNVSYRCKPCTNAENKRRASKYKGKYLETANQWRRDKVANDPEWVERRRQTKKKRYARVKKAENKRRRELYQDPNRRARILAHNKRLNRCTPKWADKELIRAMYAYCPEGFEVDHIVPINGKLVSGLHTPANLQFLTVEENKAKYNHYPVCASNRVSSC